MKKLLLSAALMIGIFSYSSAQTITKTSKKTPLKTTIKTAKIEQPKTTVQATVIKNNAPGNMAKSTPLKKDGTPDKRYKSTTKKQ